MSDANSSLKQALLDYVHLKHAPHYAVLVTGPWGIGKTFVVKGCLDTAELEDGYYYVSLFGAESKSDIDAAIFRAVHPNLGGKTAKVGGAVLKGLMSFTGISSELSLEELLDGIKGGVYVFDDLERTSLSISAILGYINDFVEHDDCRVILIANTDHKMEGDEDFRTQREKLIGRTLRVQSSLDEALDHFLTKIANERARATLVQSKTLIMDIYEASDAQNLRVLQQSLWDFERVFAVLGDEHRAEAEIVDRLVRLMLAFGIEVKMGRLRRKSLEGRSTRYSATFYGSSGKDEQRSPILVSDEQYPLVDLFDPLLTNDVLISTLMDGAFSEPQIKASLNDQPPFRQDGPTPAWRILGFGAFQEDETLYGAVETHKEEFTDLAYVEPEIILHLLFIRQRLARLELIETSESDVLDELLAYVDAVKTSGTLRPIDPSDIQHRLEHGGRLGLAYPQPDHADFKCLKAYVETACHDLFHENMAGDAPALLDLMETDPEAFLKSIAHTNSGEERYLRSPIFAEIEPRDFVDRLLSLSPDAQLRSVQALFQRYRFGGLNGDLAKEIEFVEGVNNQLIYRKGRASGFEKERIGALQSQIKSMLATVITEGEDGV